MHLGGFISPDLVIPSLKAEATKKQLLQELSARAARLTGVPERDIFDVCCSSASGSARPGLGQGIAIPHGKLAGLKRIVGIFRPPCRADRLRRGRSATRGRLSCSCCSRPKGRGPITSRRSPAFSRLLREGSAVDKLRASQDAAALLCGAHVRG